MVGHPLVVVLIEEEVLVLGELLIVNCSENKDIILPNVQICTHLLAVFLILTFLNLFKLNLNPLHHIGLLI